MRRIVGLVALAGAAVYSPALEAQCAMCRRALQSPEGQRMIAAFQSGIALLLLAPFTVFAVVAAFAVRSQRRRSLDRSQSPP